MARPSRRFLITVPSLLRPSRSVEGLVRVAPLPLAPILVELGRSPAGEDVVGHVIVGIHEAGEDVGVGHCDAGCASRIRATDRDAGDGVALDNQLAIYDL